MTDTWTVDLGLYLLDQKILSEYKIQIIHERVSYTHEYNRKDMICYKILRGTSKKQDVLL